MRKIKLPILSIIWLIILVSTACRDDRTVKIERVVQKWIGRTILFPDIEATNVVGKDSVNYISEADTIPKDYKILLYIDSSGCTSCRLHLSAWKSYIEELKSKKVDFLFYLQPEDEKELLFLLTNEQFTYPVYIDNKGEFNRLNRFPTHSAFQCFILNKDNKVLAIGNPTDNFKVRKLYSQIITGEISDTPPVTSVVPLQTEIELDDLQIGKTSEAIFVLKNTGKNLLVIQQVESSCGCTVPHWEKQPIAAGKSTEIKVNIIPEKKEYFNKTITVHCNSEQGRILLKVNGSVKD